MAARPGDVVIDAGACWGDTALYFANLVGPKGHVFAFEFDPANLTVLRANLELNPHLAGRIEIVERALWDQSGAELEFLRGGRTTAVHAPDQNTAEEGVPAVTIDDFVGATAIRQIGFIKMDIEGAERRALRGAHGVLARDRPRLAIAAYHDDDDLVDLPEIITGAASDYSFYLGSFSPVEAETVLFAALTE